MFRRLISTLRALVNGAIEEAGGRHDLALLTQQIRDAGSNVRAAQKAVALAKAQNEQDHRRIAKLSNAIEDLETRARSALAKGEDALAREAAEALAVMEAERAALSDAVEAFSADIGLLTENVRCAEARLRELKRGHRVASVREQVRAAGGPGPSVEYSSLGEAEDTLSRIKERQERGTLADQALASLSILDRPKELVARLADAGCGAPLGPSTDDVLQRLKSTPLLVSKN
ncbi:PspA/IM30 family protein [Stappia sp. GBMRC 2046]|uniref:PspA/IM30 family protein n=1 Tax=Stappia sediminis TaxID=2692190 RepID=A0A7X3LSX8_9HYPH|nr:PspA/IM30 family protein [Stappia sediminis]MXN64509.1 PspA/IM30 family protein [Stappia sediminis]